jgi:two-component sensor histidine kinase/ligand-binding sensor domain-containing protein
MEIFAQEDNIQFSHITVEDGLSLNVVTKVYQDRHGFMWFGTYNGLNRFNGYDFKIFLPQVSDKNSISNHSILSICEDDLGNLWVGTNDGLNKFDYRTGKFTVYKHNPDDSTSINNNTIRALYSDRSGTLWIGTLNGLCKYNRKKNSFISIKGVNKKLNDQSQTPVTFIYGDEQGNIWLGIWDGLTCLRKDGKIIKYDISGLCENNSSSYYYITSIIKDKNNYLWIATNGEGLFRYNLVNGLTKIYTNKPEDNNSISSNKINCLFIDSINNLWIGTDNGLNRFNRSKETFTSFQNDLFKPLSIINNNVRSICEDKTGLIWLGTSGGISKFYQTLNKFSYYKENKTNPTKGLSSSVINSVFIDKKNNIWAGTGNGLDLVKKSTGEIVQYRNDPENNNSLNNNYIRSVLIDSDGIVWIGTIGGGLNRFDPSTGKFAFFTKATSNPNSISSNDIFSLCLDHKGNLWIGTRSGLNYFDENKRNFVKYFYDSQNPGSISNNFIWAIYEDSKNMIWVGTDGGGVSCFNPVTNKFKNFVHDSSDVNNIGGNKVVTIYETRDGIMWFGSQSGLSSYNRITENFHNYNIDDGLPSLIINGIIEDQKGFLWISTDKGLSKLNRKTGVFSNFTKRNGLKDIEFSQNVVTKSSDNVLYFGGKYSLVFFNPDKIHNKLISAPVVFTDLKIFNQSVPVSADGSTILNESVTTAKSLQIPSYDDVITFEFALLDYYNEKANTFKYKLSGFDNQWNDVGTRNSATYTNLPPGDYTFYVKAINNNDKRSEKKTFLKITIIPYFYQTWWFKVLSGFVVLFIIILLFHIRTRAIQKQKKILEVKVNERTKDLDKIINELSQEVVERKKAEAKVQASLKEKDILLGEKEELLNEKVSLLEEKEVLLKEVHHRVKNNLQVISSLLYLNSRKIKDADALSMFKDSQNRVKSIALVHERLYRSRDLGKISLKEYIKQLTNDLFKSYAANKSVIRMDIDINEVFVDVDFAVPCGLIINEIISNSLKYAFPHYEEENKNGIIGINFNKNGNDELKLIVSDNGIGMPSNTAEKKKHSLGLQLIDSLVAQLGGTLKIESDSSGTSFKIIFNNEGN